MRGWPRRNDRIAARWCLFGRFLRASTGLEELDDRTLARSLGKTVARILDAEEIIPVPSGT
jgi:hypothetical protein